MAKRPVRRNIETVNPIFNIPEGVDELVYDEDASDDFNYAEGEQEEGVFGEEEEDTSNRPPTPTILGVFKQTIRTLKNGDERVDVVLSVETIEGIDVYEARVSKVE